MRRAVPKFPSERDWQALRETSESIEKGRKLREKLAAKYGLITSQLAPTKPTKKRKRKAKR